MWCLAPGTALRTRNTAAVPSASRDNGSIKGEKKTQETYSRPKRKPKLAKQTVLVRAFLTRS